MSETKFTPLVSVIMIFLNAEKFIEEAIESVLSQTYSNWELLFVDDGSTDASTEIAQGYARKYSHKMRYFEHAGHQNNGMSASRNLGIKKSTGEYIAFLDADDTYMPHKLEKQVAVLAAQPDAGMVYDATQYWHSWSGDASDGVRDSLRTLGVRADQLYSPPELVTRFLQNTARTPGTCSVLIRKRAIENVGGFEKRFSGMFEDQVFFYKLCLHEPVYVQSGYSSRYRQHAESHCHVSYQSGDWDPGHRLSSTRTMFLDWLQAYLKEKNITDPLIWRLLQRELWSYRHPKLHELMFSLSDFKGRLGSRLRNLL